MKKLITLLFCLTPLAVSAAWDTNAWPSYDWPRAGIIHARECYSGMVERASILGFDAQDIIATNQPYLGNMGTNNWPAVDGTSHWYRTSWNALAPFKGYGQRDSLVSLKAAFLNNIIASYADYTQTNAAGVFYGTNFTSFALYTGPTICIAAGVPTNYFEFTPYRGLNGAGPFTNDATTPAPHGWTNATTAAGGTNFPAARTNAIWYTTDYGWQGLKDMIDACRWTLLEPESGTEVRRTYSPGDFFDSCGEAYTDATNDWADATTSTNSGDGDYEVGLGFGKDWTYVAIRSYAYPAAFNVPVTNSLECSIDAYYKYTPYTLDPSGATNNFFDIDSTGKTNGLWWYFESYAEGGTTNRGGLGVVTAIGKTSMTDPFLDWPISCPVSGNTLASTNWNGSGEYAVWGGVRSYDQWVLKWNGPNGFDFIE